MFKFKNKLIQKQFFSVVKRTNLRTKTRIFQDKLFIAVSALWHKNLHCFEVYKDLGNYEYHISGLYVKHMMTTNGYILRLIF